MYKRVGAFFEELREGTHLKYQQICLRQTLNHEKRDTIIVETLEKILLRIETKITSIVNQ